jgi:SagB-type dehydrogenase family enzyme
MNALDCIWTYHEQTKHHFFRYARALGYMDWANQPDPFRRFAGAPLFPLPLLRPDEDPSSPPYADLYVAGAVPPTAVTARSLSRFLEYALAISAWKQFQGTRWALRSNPSSGNLHPTEGYLLVEGKSGLAPQPALYHYAAKDHALELRLECPAAAFAALMQRFPPGAFLAGLSSIHWREAWKYGERAYRYCQHDAGHAIATIRLAAATLGWKAVLLEGTDDETVSGLLGLGRHPDFADAEREHPDCFLAVWPFEDVRGEEVVARGEPIPLFLDKALVQEVVKGAWHGKANRLSREDAVRWEIIDETAAAAWKSVTSPIMLDRLGPRGQAPAGTAMEGLAPAMRVPVPLASTGGQTPSKKGVSPHEPEPVPMPHGDMSAGEIIRRRRSAVAFDGKTGIQAVAFFRMLSHVMPQSDVAQWRRPAPWDAWPWKPRIHLGLFVHLVDGIPPGLYMLVREPSKKEILQKAMHAHFAWTTPPGCPERLSLFLLQEGDARELAAQVSCHQSIAGDGAFALGMIAEGEEAMLAHGPWFYRRLYWETGLIGQVLYLDAEAEGVRATGIGCFFDDPVHNVFGIKDRAFQSLYHFTIGGPVEDPRLTTLPAYEDVRGEG